MSETAEILADGPIRFLDFNETSGTVAADSSTSNTPATLTVSGVTYSAPGLTFDGDTALTFSGVGHAYFPASADLNFGTAPCTVKFRIKATSGGGAGTFVAIGSTAPDPWWIGFAAGKLVVSVANEAWTIVGPTAPTDGRSHEIGMTRSGTSLLLYLDGVEVGSAVISAGLALGDATTAVGVGAFGSGSFPLNGTYDKVAIYKGSALSAARMLAHNDAAGFYLRITQSSLDPHTAGQTVNLTSSAAGWSGSTVFSVSGVADVTITNVSVTSASAVTLTITTGTAHGTLTISDGTNSDTIAVLDRKTVLVTTDGGTDLEVIEPAAYTGATAAVLAFYFHGLGETRTAWNDDTLKWDIRDALLDNGVVLVGTSAGVNWGNDSGLAKYADSYAYVLANYNVRSTMFVGQSMGGICCLRAVHNPDSFPKVRGAYLIYPAVSPLNVYDDSLRPGSTTTEFADEILDAWGAANRVSLVTALDGKDPITLDTSGYPNIYYRFHASSGDTIILKAHNTDVMRALLDSTATRENSLVVCTGDHGDPSHFDAPDAVQFSWLVWAAADDDTAPDESDGFGSREGMELKCGVRNLIIYVTLGPGTDVPAAIADDLSEANADMAVAWREFTDIPLSYTDTYELRWLNDTAEYGAVTKAWAGRTISAAQSQDVPQQIATAMNEWERRLQMLRDGTALKDYYAANVDEDDEETGAGDFAMVEFERTPIPAVDEFSQD